jgi:hypothetical protein
VDNEKNAYVKPELTELGSFGTLTKYGSPGGTEDWAFYEGDVGLGFDGATAS